MANFAYIGPECVVLLEYDIDFGTSGASKTQPGERSMRGNIATVGFGVAFALAVLAIPRQASAEDVAPYCANLSGQARVSCDARLAKWMQRQNGRIKNEGANGGCGGNCEDLIAKRNKAAQGFEALDADDENK
jgi:hypothetical protein